MRIFFVGIDGYFSHAPCTITVTLPIDAIKSKWYGYLILSQAIFYAYLDNEGK